MFWCTTVGSVWIRTLFGLAMLWFVHIVRSSYTSQSRHSECDGVSHNRLLDCLLNLYFKCRHQSSASLAFVRRNHPWLVDYPHKTPIIREMFPLDDVIMRIIFYSYILTLTLQIMMHPFVGEPRQHWLKLWFVACIATPLNNTNADFLSIGSLETNFNDYSIKRQTFWNVENAFKWKCRL